MLDLTRCFYYRLIISLQILMKTKELVEEVSWESLRFIFEFIFRKILIFLNDKFAENVSSDALFGRILGKIDVST